jgi:hypothetical protein
MFNIEEGMGISLIILCLTCCIFMFYLMFVDTSVIKLQEKCKIIDCTKLTPEQLNKL